MASAGLRREQGRASVQWSVPETEDLLRGWQLLCVEDFLADVMMYGPTKPQNNEPLHASAFPALATRAVQ